METNNLSTSEKLLVFVAVVLLISIGSIVVTTGIY